jgi:poly(A) polymerase
MTEPATRAVLAGLSADGATVRFVGGCVRDAVLGRPVTDIDIATHDSPETVMRLLQRAGIRVIPTGIAHGTVTAVVDTTHFEITTLRRDVETYGRRAKVAFTDDWAADAARRDLTMNALFSAPDGTLYDPFGGLDDLRHGRVRFVGNAEQRIVEDVLRLLRFFRFYAWYGRPPVDEEALAACRRLAPKLPALSGERVCGETFKLLAAPDPAPVFRLMAANQVLAHFLPEARNFRRLSALVTVEGVTHGADPLRRLAALIGDGSAARGAATAVARRLRMSNAERARLESLAAPPERVAIDLDRRARRRALYRLGAERFRDLALLAWADTVEAPTRQEIADWQRLLSLPERWTPPDFPLSGRDVLALGIPPGPRVGQLLGPVQEWWVAGDFTADRNAALGRLRGLAADAR